MSLQLRVTGIEQVTRQVKVFTVESVGDRPLPAYTAGAHLEFRVPLRPDKVEKRAYSIASDPKERYQYVFGVLREPESTGGSAYMHEQVAEGQILEADGPINNFPLSDKATKHLLIAGGIGITPILSMAHELINSGRSCEMHYCARSPADMAFRHEVETLCGDVATLHFDGGDPGRGLDLRTLLKRFEPGRHVYVCGPRGLIEAVCSACTSAGWPDDHVHYEFFGAVSDTRGGDELEVLLAESGRTLTVQPSQSILDAILDAGGDIDFDCKRGECGMCVAEVLEGRPVHRDTYLSASERAAGACMCTCVSWAEPGRLVLKL